MPIIEQCEPRLLMSAIAYEGFEYAVGTLTGDAGGSGRWAASGWTGASTATVVSGSLVSVSSPSSTMTTTGESASVSWQQTATRNLDVSGGPLVQAGDTLWVSFVVNNVDSPDNYDASLRLDSASGPIWLGTPYAGTYSISTGSDWVAGTGTPPVDGTSHLIVAKIQYLDGTNSAGGNAIVSIWADPTTLAYTDGNELVPAAAAGSLVNYNISATISSPTAVGLCAGDIFYGAANFDEVRIGTTYGDVGPSALIAPSDIAFNEESESQFSVRWTDNSNDEDAFELQYATNADFSENLTVISLPANTTSFSNAVTLGTTYYYRVRALKDGSTPVESEFAETVWDTARYNAPDALTSVPNSTGNIELNWLNTSELASNIVIHRSLDYFGTWEEIVVPAAGPGQQTFLDQTANGNTNYSYEVFASGVTPSATSQAAGPTTTMASDVISYTKSPIKYYDSFAAVSAAIGKQCPGYAKKMIDSATIIAVQDGEKWRLKVTNLAWHTEIGITKMAGFPAWNWKGYVARRGQTDADWYNKGNALVTYWSMLTHESQHVLQYETAAKTALLAAIANIEGTTYDSDPTVLIPSAQVTLQADALLKINAKFNELYPVKDGFLPGQEGEEDATQVERAFLEGEYKKANP